MILSLCVEFGSTRGWIPSAAQLENLASGPPTAPDQDAPEPRSAPLQGVNEERLGANQGEADAHSRAAGAEAIAALSFYMEYCQEVMQAMHRERSGKR